MNALPYSQVQKPNTGALIAILCTFVFETHSYKGGEKWAEMAGPVPTETFLQPSAEEAVLSQPSAETHPPPPIPISQVIAGSGITS